MNLNRTRLDVVTFPASQPGNTLILGHGCPPAGLMLGNTKLAAVAVARFYSPGDRRRTKKRAASGRPSGTVIRANRPDGCLLVVGMRYQKLRRTDI